MSLDTPPMRTTFQLSAFHQNNSTSNIEPKRKSGASSTKDVDMDADSSHNSTDEEEEEENGSTVGTGIWTKEEHTRFLEAIKIYANGPWKLVAAYVQTRTVRQTMTHAQKYRQKAARRLRGLRTKQALMRMHYGHRISEESLVQERLRALTAQVEAASTSPRPLYTPAARRAASSLRSKTSKSPVASAGTTDSARSTGSLLALLNDPNPECTVDAAANFLTGARAAPTGTGASRRHTPKASSKATPPRVTIKTETFVSSTEATTSPTAATSTEMDTTMTASFDTIMSDLDIIDDLSEAPSLEECAEMLYDLLCC